MKKVVVILLFIVGLAAAGGLAAALFTPWMDSWGATEAEIGAVLPGDELVPEPASSVNRAITIDAPPSPTPTPEVYLPLDPAPTPSGSDLPLTCQVTDLNVYIERAAGYCFAYPARFTLGDEPSDQPPVLGPALGSPVEPIHATFAVEVVPFAEGKTLEQQADEYLKGFTVVDPSSLSHQQVMVGGEAGILVEPVPVQLSWRIVFVQHAGSLYRLYIWPVDVPEAKADVDELSQVTLNTFAFIEK